MNTTALTGGSTRNTAARYPPACTPSSSASRARWRSRRPASARTGHVQLDDLQHQQQEEQVPLVAGDEPDRAAACVNLPFGERHDAAADVGVLAFLVGVGVVPAGCDAGVDRDEDGYLLQIFTKPPFEAHLGGVHRL